MQALPAYTDILILFFILQTQRRKAPDMKLQTLLGGESKSLVLLF